MVYAICDSCKIWTPIYSMNVDSLFFDFLLTKSSGICILCDETIPRNKFININQLKIEESDLVLLSQIQQSQVEINFMIKNKNNEKISLLSNIYEMVENKFEWNGNFDIISLGRE